MATNRARSSSATISRSQRRTRRRTRSSSTTVLPPPHSRATDARIPKTCTVLKTDGDIWDAEMNQINASKNMDKFYVLQLLVTPSRNACYLFTHWGRTGTMGQVKAERFRSLKAACVEFQKKFSVKTGYSWSNRHSQPTQTSKYNYVQQNYARKRAKTVRWTYELIHDPMGKPDGWYTYDGDATTPHTATSNMEDYYAQFQSNGWLNVRFVHSGQFIYRIDFQSMTQQNTTSHKIRRIRRTT